MWIWFQQHSKRLGRAQLRTVQLYSSSERTVTLYSLSDISIDKHRFLAQSIHPIDELPSIMVSHLDWNVLIFTSYFWWRRHVDLEFLQSSLFSLKIGQLFGTSFPSFPCGDIVKTSIDHEQLNVQKTKLDKN